MQFTIFTDSSSNLPKSLLTKYQLESIPFAYRMRDADYLCPLCDEFDGAAYYEALKRGERVTISQISPQRFTEAVEPFLAEGQDVMYIGMSSGVSGSYSSACVASETLREKYPERRLIVIDTRAASLGEGICALKAAEMRAQGMSIGDVEKEIRAMAERVYQIFTVDDLIHLHRTGRVSGASCIVGTVLQIKPLLKGNEQGKIVAVGKVRGRKKAIQALADKYNALVRHPENQIVGIAHANNPEDAAALAELLRRDHPPKEILTVCYEPVTGAHVGPGTVALFFEAFDGVRGM